MGGKEALSLVAGGVVFFKVDCVNVQFTNALPCNLR